MQMQDHVTNHFRKRYASSYREFPPLAERYTGRVISLLRCIKRSARERRRRRVFKDVRCVTETASAASCRARMRSGRILEPHLDAL